MPLRFNTELQEFVIESFTVALVGSKGVRSTAKLTVPFLINNVPLSANEELIMEVPEKTKQPEKRKCPDWKDAAKRTQEMRMKSAVAYHSQTAVADTRIANVFAFGTLGM